MRFIILVKPDESTEAAAMPSEQLLAEMGKYNELVKAGVMLADEGLHPGSKGARVEFSGSERTVIDGPFSEAKELIAGFWPIEVRPEFTPELREQEERLRAQVAANVKR